MMTKDDRCDLSASVVGAAAAGLLGGWVAAGSTGVLAEPFRVVLTWLPLTLSAMLVRPTWRMWWVVCIATMLCLRLVLRVHPIHEVLLVAALLAALAHGQSRAPRRALVLCSLAIFALGLFRIVCLSVPSVWLLANSLGAAMGASVGSSLGRPLSIGASFGGVDYLVVMTVFLLGWLGSTKGPWFPKTVSGLLAIAVGQFIYLVLLAWTPRLSETLPTLPPPAFHHPYVPPDWNWADAVRQLLPWNTPLLGAVIHTAIACFMLRWANWSLGSAVGANRDDSISNGRRSGRWHGTVLLWVVLAVLIAVSATFAVTNDGLEGKVLVANQHGDLDWGKPQHDRYGQLEAGQFGMIPALIDSLGGNLDISPIPVEQLAGSDVLMLLHPTAPMSETDHGRIWDFVRAGGALFIVAKPPFQKSSEESTYNQLLSPTSIRVRRDVAVSETGNWQHAGQAFVHPVTTNCDPKVGCLLSDSGASLRIERPARPLIVGRWGWSDPGSDALLTGLGHFEAGETLGDLVLMAEQTVGKGTVVVVGDGSFLTNEGLVRGHDLATSLLQYLANRDGNPTPMWRQLLNVVFCLALLVIVCRRAEPQLLIAVAVALAISLAASSAVSRSMARVVPDGRAITTDDGDSKKQTESAANPRASRLAYIDASHIEAYSNRDWSFNAINGLALNLMREGFLTLSLPEISRDRLERAAIVVSIAPARQFSRRERAILREFVDGGGVFICTIGAEEAKASESLLADFGLCVPRSPVPTTGEGREPEPMGRFRSLYLDASDYGAGDYKVGVAFHAGWPVEATRDGAEVLVHGKDDWPIVVRRNVGLGSVILIGDSGFAMNKNLEYIGGEPFEGRYENAHFWRWLMARAIGDEDWVPPQSDPSPDAGDTEVEE